MTARLSLLASRHGYLLALVAIALSTGLFIAGRGLFATSQWALLYLLIILLVAGAAGTRPALLASVLAFFAWNFFFLPPYHTLRVHDPKDWLALVAFLIVGLLVGLQTGRMREREARAVARERETAALNRLSAAVTSQTSTQQMVATCLEEIVTVLGAGSASLYAFDGEELRSLGDRPASPPLGPEVAVHARNVMEAERTRGAAEPALTAATTTEDGGLWAVVRGPSGVAGVLAVRAREDGVPYTPEAGRLVVSLANLVAAFLERERLQAAAAGAAAEREADRLKSSLLSSVSHELKTPLAALTATVSNLLESDVAWDEQNVHDELRAIVGDVARLNSSIGSLLDLSRLEARSWEPRRELYELGEIVDAAVAALPAHLRGRVAVDLPEREPIVAVDFVQWTRVLQNLLENALLYTAEGTPVGVGAHAWRDGVRIWVEDQGAGIPEAEHEAVFEKFYRGRRGDQRAPSGTGLGLAIVREIVRAHGGSVRVEDVTPHGARFVIALPTAEPPAPKEGR